MQLGFTRIVSVVVPTLLLAACELSVENNGPVSDETKAKVNDVMSATVAGTSWNVRANDTWFDVVNLESNSIGGRDAAIYIGFRLNGVRRTGTFPIGGAARPNATVDVRKDGALYIDDAVQSVGTVTISELTPTRISGTFSFTVPRFSGATTAAASVAVTNGSFSIAVWPPYSVSITP